MKKMIRYLFFGSPSTWYFGSEVTPEAKIATIEWINDRAKMHVWVTSVATGSIVFLATLGPPTSIQTAPGVIKVVGLGLMLTSVLVNIVCVWSLSNWKLNVSRDAVTDGARMRFDIEVSSWIALGSFFLGLVTTVIPVVL